MEQPGNSASSVPWYFAGNAGEIPSPALLIYPQRIEENIRRMIQIAGDTSLLRPHIKTHKMAEILKIQQAYQINKCKCSTISEAELAARCSIADILLAYQPVGPQIPRFFQLMKSYPNLVFSVIVDNEAVIRQLSDTARNEKINVGIWLDINNGMNRTGIAPGQAAKHLYELICSLPFLNIRGLHIYDGHIHEKDFTARKAICKNDFQPVEDLIHDLESSGYKVPRVVAGGTPTFPIHARRKNTETSPGTPLLWDAGYSNGFPDLDFLHAAVVFSRIVSKPGNNLICLDLGHKAIAAEMPHPRIQWFGLEDYTVRNHSEEHLVLEIKNADQYKTGDCFYGIPTHICPTVVRYDAAFIVEDNQINGSWQIAARDRKLSI